MESDLTTAALAARAALFGVEVVVSGHSRYNLAMFGDTEALEE